MMNAIYAFTLIMLAIAIGNIIAVKTKSIVSMLFSVSVIFVLAFALGLPRTIFADSNLQALGTMLIPPILVHLGTSMNIRQLLEQWRVVIVAIAAILGIVAFVVGIGQFMVGRPAAFTAAPPIAGGIIAGIQMGQTAADIGLSELQILASLLVVVQGFVGYPVASFVLKREGQRILSDYRQGKITSLQTEAKLEASEHIIGDIHDDLKSDEWYLAKLALVASLAVFISQAVKSLVGYNLMDQNILALIFGVLAHQLGFLESNPLNKANSNGLAMASLTVVVISGLANATADVLISLLPVILITLGLGTIGIVIFASLAGKWLKMSTWLAMGIGISALFGFPGTYIVPVEVANALSDKHEERQIILERIQPQMLVAGFVTVSIASVVLAGILSPMLAAMG
ncbi:hypothetical protein [Aerococcus urinae]